MFQTLAGLRVRQAAGGRHGRRRVARGQTGPGQGRQERETRRRA